MKRFFRVPSRTQWIWMGIGVLLTLVVFGAVFLISFYTGGGKHCHPHIHFFGNAVLEYCR